MKAEEYLVIQGWMYALDLTDKQRLAYAIIWGYSRDGRSVCRTTAKQLAEWLDCKQRNAQYIVRQLEDMGLIGHEVVTVSARRGHPAGVMTDFWAVLPEQAEKPEKKARIDWAGRAKVTQRVAQPGYATDCVTTLIGTTRKKYISGGCGKNSARSRAKKTTTTTGFLFENSDTGQQAGNPLPLTLPFEEVYFREAWEMLLRQPAWAGKSPEALAIQLEEFQECGDPVLATYCIRLAIKKGWSDIKDIQAIFTADMDQVLAFADVCNARREEGKA